MKKTHKEIIAEIRGLLDELEANASHNPSTPKKENHGNASDYSGCSGGLRQLASQGYFNEPRDKQEVMTKLKEAGRYYSSSLVSMNLLNLSGNRERLLTKLGQRGSYKFVLRK